MDTPEQALARHKQLRGKISIKIKDEAFDFDKQAQTTSVVKERG